MSLQKQVFIFLIGLILWSCDKSTQEEDVAMLPEKANVAPSMPELVYPTNNLLCTSNVLAFHWNASIDSDGDALAYRIEVSRDNQFTEIDHSFTGKATTQNLTLDKGVAYYWRVQAIDSKEALSDFSATFNLYTENEGLSNHLPFAPTLIRPEENTTVQENVVKLAWAASDIDEDPLLYDIYFGTENPPTAMVSENQNTTTFEVEIGAASDYYWKIIAKDDKGGQTVGQVWTFNTD